MSKLNKKSEIIVFQNKNTKLIMHKLLTDLKWKKSKLEKQGAYAVFIFGSQVTGKANENSDTDICFMGKFTEKSKTEIEREFYSENIDISFFEDLPIWIKIRVFKEGKSLLTIRQDEVYKIAFRTIRDYEDFKPLLVTRIIRRFGRCTI